MTLDIFDFFSGCGGSSKGFQNSGLTPVFALDSDEDSAESYRINFPKVQFKKTDILHYDTKELDEIILDDMAKRRLFCGCAPCQPFTKQNTKKPDKEKDKRRLLLSKFGEVIEKYLPDYVFMENVPGMQHVLGNSTLSRFKKRLDVLNYHTSVEIVQSKKYGVPQRRRRLLLLASKHGPVHLPEQTHGPEVDTPYSTVRDWIGSLPPIAAGEIHPTVPHHRAANLSALNLRRIMATPPEGSRADWPVELQLSCHSKAEYVGHTDVYGRMKWDAPATGLTTRCISLSNGRFGHPEQHRAISVREAATLQTFPDDFMFSGSLHSQARQIGNAVPVLLAEVVGRYFIEHANKYMD